MSFRGHDRVQEIVKMRLSVSRLETARSYPSQVVGFVRMNLVIDQQEVVTDHLLISDEAVRVLDVRT
jgi:hypothetical protein